MSINSSLAAGVSGLVANSSALSAISDNIANANTVGYKQNSTQFSDLVTSSSIANDYNAGGVNALTTQLVAQQGGSEQTSSTTDLSITGNGMFVVAGTANPAANDPRSYTRAGSFTVDANGDLQNAAGYYLQGWPVNSDGAVKVNPSDVTSLQTINVGDVGGTATPTTVVSINANLDSAQTVSAVANASSGQATLASNDATWSYSLPAAAANATYTITDSSGAVVYTETDANLAAGANTFSWNGVNGSGVQLSNGGSYTLSISATAAGGAAVTPTSVEGAGAYDPATNNMASGAVTPDATIQLPVSDSEGGQRTLQIDLLKSSTANSWYAELVATPASSVQTGSGLNNGQLATGTLVFNSDGSINMANSTLFKGSTSPTIQIGASASTALGASDYAWAAGLGISAQKISLNLSDAPGGITQLDSASATESVNSNGTQFGSLTSVAIDDKGFVTATYSNGVSKKIAQVALATFDNPDGLKATSGDAYQVSSTSGSYNLKTAGSGGAGTITPSELETSTVDLSTQFASLITTQEAYSASAKVITTADQMLQALINIKQ